MRTLSCALLLGLAVALSAAGCTVDGGTTIHHRGGIGGGLPAPGQVYHIDPGASATVYPGQQAGYAITANVGGSYRLVWTGDAGASGGYREFWGSVYTQGHFSRVAAFQLIGDDYLSGPINVGNADRVDFDSYAANGIHGFDFVVDTEPAIFDFVIDGAHYPQLVFFSSSGQLSSTATFPFGLTTQ